MIRKYICFAFLLLVLPFVSACNTVPAEELDCKSEDVFCVGLVTELGEVEDAASNQATWEGIRQAVDDDPGVVANYIETTDSRDYEKNISTFGEAGYDLIVTKGYGQSKATLQSALNYPKSMFIGVDQVFSTDIKLPTNLVILEFPEDQAGFLVGALAMQMSQTKKVGAVCATDGIPSIWRYCEGFRAGALYIDAEADVKVWYHNNVSFEQALNDPDWGKFAADSIILQGVDVVFGVGGETGMSALRAASEQAVYIIGVDTDMFYSMTEARKLLLSSAIKLISDGVYELVILAKKGEFPGGQKVMGGAGYAPFHGLQELVSDEIKKRLDDISAGIKDGSIQTGAREKEIQP